MQFMPETAIRYGLRDPHDPKRAIDAGARYLRDLLVRFGGRVELALAAYNAGEGTVGSFLTGKPLFLPTGKVVNARGLITDGIPPYRETENYVKSAMALIRLTRATSAGPSPRQENRKHFGIKTRDFTLDVMTKPGVGASKTDSKPPATFIDIP
jgi:hypothetical protein